MYECNILREQFITDGTFIHWFLVREARSFRIFADVECKCEIKLFTKKNKSNLYHIRVGSSIFFS